MKRVQAVILLLAMLLGCAALSACDGTPSDVTIDGSELVPNDRNPQQPGNTDGEPDRNDGGIGDNEAVDLPYLPV